MLVSGVTPEELLDVAQDTGVLGGSPLSRDGSLMPFAMAPRASSSRTVGVQVPVAFFLQRKLVTRSRGGPATGRCGDTHR